MAQLPLSQWHDFYMTMGTASGAIVGAIFIVATLAAGLKERAAAGLRGFIAPTTVHLASVLIASVILNVPDLSRDWFAALTAAGGVTGLAYGAIIALRLRTMTLTLDDRFFYKVAPMLAYATMLAAAAASFFSDAFALDLLAASLVALLAVGVRNAWDMASFVITH